MGEEIIQLVGKKLLDSEESSVVLRNLDCLLAREGVWH